MSNFWEFNWVTCPDREKHREPAGPNEDSGQCPLCGSFTYSMRPEGETYGLHADDCSLPVRHEGYCVGGGSGHPPAEEIRGWFEFEEQYQSGPGARSPQKIEES